MRDCLFYTLNVLFRSLVIIQWCFFKQKLKSIFTQTYSNIPRVLREAARGEKHYVQSFKVKTRLYVALTCVSFHKNGSIVLTLAYYIYFSCWIYNLY